MSHTDYRISLIFGVLIVVLSACGDTGLWEPDCSVGECGDERERAGERAGDADFDLAERDELGTLDIGETIIVTGEVFDEYAELTFEAESGEWFDIAVYSLGLPNPLFILDQSGLEDEAYKRRSPVTEDGLGERAVMINGGGEQRLRIYDGAQSEPGFMDEWRFVVEIERRRAPEPQDVEVGAELVINADDVRGNLFRVHHSELADSLGAETRFEENITFNSLHYGPDFEHESTVLLHYPATMELGSEPSTETVFFADYGRAQSPDGHYIIELFEQRDLDSGESVEETFELDAGEVWVAKNIDHDGSGVVDIELLKNEEVLAEYSRAFQEPEQVFPGAYYGSEDGGEYTIRLSNPRSRSVEGARWWSGVVEPESMGSIGRNDQLAYRDDQRLAGDSVAVTDFEVTDSVELEISAEIVRSPVFRIVEFGGDVEQFEIFRIFESGEDFSHTVDLEPGRYFIVAYPYDEPLEEGYDILLTTP